jgi:hypothetical protein
VTNTLGYSFRARDEERKFYNADTSKHWNTVANPKQGRQEDGISDRQKTHNKDFIIV